MGQAISNKKPGGELVDPAEVIVALRQRRRHGIADQENPHFIVSLVGLDRILSAFDQLTDASADEASAIARRVEARDMQLRLAGN